MNMAITCSICGAEYKAKPRGVVNKTLIRDIAAKKNKLWETRLYRDGKLEHHYICNECKADHFNNDTE